MDVYFASNFWDDRKNEKPLKMIPVNKEFQWEELYGRIPALYIGDKGVAVDVCIRIPAEKVEAFLRKWNQERRLSALTDEEYEELESDNPLHFYFNMDITINGEKMTESAGCSTVWHPLELEKENIGCETEMLMKEYGCDRDDAWIFWRWTAHFNEEKTVVPKTVTFDFRTMAVPFTAGHFETEEGFKERELEIKNPYTGEDYKLTLYGCEPETMEKDTLSKLRRGWVFPAQYQILSYSISPEPFQGRFQILDCAKSDAPKEIKRNEEGSHCTVSTIGGTSGASAVFFAGKSRDIQKRTAMSSPHFEKADKIRWRAVFYEKVRKDLRLTVVLEDS